VAYNQFAARIKVFAAAVDDFSRELLNSMEEIQVRPSMTAPASPTPMTPRSLSDAGRELPSRG
jgi:biopolymer transport protein TolQ